MAMTAAQASQTLLNTDYTFDKILETYTGSFSAAARHGALQPRRTTSTISHGIGTYGLIIGSYTTDGTTWLPFGVINANTSGAFSFQTVEVTAYCTTSDVVVVASNYLSSSKTVEYALQIVARD